MYQWDRRADKEPHTWLAEVSVELSSCKLGLHNSCWHRTIGDHLIYLQPERSSLPLYYYVRTCYARITAPPSVVLATLPGEFRTGLEWSISGACSVKPYDNYQQCCIPERKHASRLFDLWVIHWLCVCIRPGAGVRSSRFPHSFDALPMYFYHQMPVIRL